MKKIMNIILILISTITMMFFTTSCAKEDTLYVATSPDYMPFCFVDLRYTDQQRYVGADIKLAKMIAAELNMKLEIMAMGFQETLLAVQSQKADIAISGYTKNEEREKNFLMSVTYRENGEGYQGFLVLEKNKDKYNSLSDFDKVEVKVGAQNPSVQLDIATSKLNNAQIVKFGQLDQGILMLKEEKIDAISISSINASILCKKDDSLYLSEVILDEEESNLHVIANKNNAKLMEKINPIIEKINKYKLYDAWLNEAYALIAYLDDLAVEVE